jgi:hypothetical protein
MSVFAHGKWIEVEVVNPPNAKKARRHRDDTFVQVPLGVAAKFAKVTNTPRAMVWLMVLYEAWANKGKPFTLSDKKLTGFGVKRNTRLRALNAMEAAGLITVEWKNGCAPVVTLVEPAQP